MFGPHIRQFCHFMHTIWVSLSLLAYLDENENTAIVKARGKLPLISVKNHVMTYREVHALHGSECYLMPRPLRFWGKRLLFPLDRGRHSGAERAPPLPRMEPWFPVGPKYIDISQEYLLNQFTLQIAYTYKRTVVRCSVGTDGWG